MIIYKSIKISPLKCIFADKVIFILYTNLQKIGETISYDCVEENVNKKILLDINYDSIKNSSRYATLTLQQTQVNQTISSVQSTLANLNING